jgi:hypothetical protein
MQHTPGLAADGLSCQFKDLCAEFDSIRQPFVVPGERFIVLFHALARDRAAACVARCQLSGVKATIFGRNNGRFNEKF